MKKIWVTGAHGFLGRYLCRHLADQNGYVLGIGHGHWKLGEFKKWGLKQWFFSDITLPALCELESKTGKPDIIFHAAGSGSVHMSIVNPYLDYGRTVGTLLDVLEFARMKSPNAKIVYPSSAAVYGSVKKGKISEDAPFKPISPYGVHKTIAEELCGSYASHFGINVSVIRFFSLYGNGLTKQLLWDLCCKFENANQEIYLYGTGKEVRDWLHIDDGASLMILASTLKSDKIIKINGGSGIGLSIKQIADEICKAFGTDTLIKFNGLVKEGDPKHYQADIKQAESCGWKPLRDWRQGMADYVKWFKDKRSLL